MKYCDRDRSRASIRFVILTLLLSINLSLSSCSQLPIISEIDRQELNAVLKGDALIRAGILSSYVPPEDSLLLLNDEMKAFLRHYVPAQGSRKQKLDALLYALVHKGILGFQYDPEATFTAIDAFENRAANCMGFSLLFVAMAREVGLRVNFNEVAVPPIWEFQGKTTFILYKHINSIVKVRGGREKVVDINMTQYRSYYRQELLSDKQAKAQYFNNRGVSFLMKHDLASAYRYFRKGLSLDPEAGYIWSSMGTLYRRAGLLREAELAYLEGLTYRPSSLVILSNLSYLYEAMGEKTISRLYRNKVQSARAGNPYYRFALAQKAFEDGDFLDAKTEIQVALERNSKDHKFWYLAARISARLNSDDDAYQYLRKAIELVQDEDDRVLYQATQLQWQSHLPG